MPDASTPNAGVTASSEHFDAKAKTWDDDPERKARAADVALQIMERAPLTANVDVLDFGSGTGLVGPRWQLDAAGHYARLDVFELHVHRDPRPMLVEHGARPAGEEPGTINPPESR